MHKTNSPGVCCTKYAKGEFFYVRPLRPHEYAEIRFDRRACVSRHRGTDPVHSVLRESAPAAKIESAGEEIRFDRIRSAGDRVQFLSQFGYVVDETPIEECEVLIPKEFDRVFAAYNEMQKGEGLDLSRYKGKKMMRYTYNVTNYEGYSDPVYANILVYKNKVVGGDVCSADPNGFAHGLTKS